ncbi:MAG: type IV pilus modification protein PilV [Gammaproteobacteria bacterium]|nr:type IV pilus modification protein PilV [Gammaproteobacteria bacterium]
MTRRSQQTGFSLLEVLVSVFILAVGLLGLASLQAFSIRGSMGSQHHSQAVLIAQDMMERMRANKGAALAGGYNLDLDDPPPAGGNGTPLEDDDRAGWFANFLTLLPEGDASIGCDANGRCTVIIQWNDSRAEEGATTQHFDFTSQI